MGLFDIMGPVMVGPSSSHTAGAVKIGYIAGKLLKERIVFADIYLHGSFLATGKGHGTDKALIAGLLGMKPDDERIPSSLELAAERGLKYKFSGIKLRNAHPNSVLMKLKGINGSRLEVEAASIGGGMISITGIDGVAVDISASCPTLIVHNVDEPGLVSAVTTVLGQNQVNIGTMHIYRDKRGGNAVMTIECDQEIPAEVVTDLHKIDGVCKVIYLSMEEENEHQIP
ncbi:MAG: L-serine ammonia-lyase, iron-sulfur-dependent subunit beta [Caldicoprobacterales bacterium]|nr:L-serine ammonia-lyase, iron-sulfur-dependent, subunit beta [Clostridiales bacterium]